MTEFWVPMAQDQGKGSVLYGDLRMMGDDNDNREFNLGIGYREMVHSSLLDSGIVGAHIWYDRRLTDRGSAFNQVTAGMEWFGNKWDAKLNAYYPLNDGKTFTQTNPNGSGVGFVGNQVLINTDQTVEEEALPGLDLELGWRVPAFDEMTDSTRIYGGVYHYEGDKSDNVSGWRTRIASDITSNIQVGARFQRDDERGSQGFLEATIRFPFGHKKSYRKAGLYARLDESPERDIDIISNEAVTDDGVGKVLLNAQTGSAQNIIHVDNTAGGGGDGSVGTPYNTLAAAEGAAGAHDIIYVHRGDGTSAGQNAGITINDQGQKLIGSGTALTYNPSIFATPNGNDVKGSARTLIAADPSGSPVITNGAGEGIVVSSVNNVIISGLTIDGTTDDAIEIINSDNLIIENNTIRNADVFGIDYVATGTNNIGSVVIRNNSLSMNGDGGTDSGIRVRSTADSILAAVISGNDVDQSFYRGFWIEATDDSTLTTTIYNNVTMNNGSAGIATNAQGNAVHTTTVYNNVSDTDNTGLLLASAVGANNSTINAYFYNNIVRNSTNHGVFLGNSTTATGTYKFEGNTVTGSAINGFVIDDDSAQTITVDLGGGALGSTGGNAFFSNTGAEISVDLDGGELKAENNFWGSATGLAGGETVLNDASSIDSDPFLSEAP